MSRIIYSCAEHVEEIIDIFLDEVCEMPVMEVVEEVEFIENTITCNICDLGALYRLSGSEVKTKWE